MNAKSWYREPWPWLLMAGPAGVIVAGVVTAWLAIASADGVVVDDYYKQGLGINRTLKREQAAAAAGISATVEHDATRIRVHLKGAAPPALFAQLVHTTRSGYDQRLRLEPVQNGSYEADLSTLPPGRWRVVLDDPRGEWRLTMPPLTLSPAKGEGRAAGEERP